MPELIERPPGVPARARYFPPADDFEPVAAAVREHAGRGYLRAWVPFVIWRFDGVMLTRAAARSLSVHKRTWSMGRCLIWSDHSRPVPGVWVWSLADERADREGQR
jgi:hypothetical protein